MRREPRSPGHSPIRWIARTVLGLALLGGAFGLGSILPPLWERHGKSLREATKQLETPRLPSLGLPEMAKARPSKVVYLNREGARLHGGQDDSAHNVSSIVGNAGLEYADVPPFAGTPKRWSEITRCIAALFSRYDITLVDQRPMDGTPYIMAMVGGAPSLLGDDLPKSLSRVTGLAPFNGEPIEEAVVTIFSRAMRERTRPVCETAAMEIAHAYGLDHARHCRDVMTYMRPCGKKSFLDRAIACGEDKDRPCKGDAPTQNSHALLLSVLGPRKAQPAKSPPRKPAKSAPVGPPTAAHDGHLHKH